MFPNVNFSYLNIVFLVCTCFHFFLLRKYHIPEQSFVWPYLICLPVWPWRRLNGFKLINVTLGLKEFPLYRNFEREKIWTQLNNTIVSLCSLAVSLPVSVYCRLLSPSDLALLLETFCLIFNKLFVLVQKRKKLFVFLTEILRGKKSGHN